MIDVVLTVRVKDKNFMARKLLPGIFLEKSLTPCFYFQKIVLNDGPLLIVHLPYV